MNQSGRFLRIGFWLLLLSAGSLIVYYLFVAEDLNAGGHDEGFVWTPPDSTSIPDLPNADLIQYGRELIAHTSEYLGPQGRVFASSNGMNCQNCHLKAGKKFFGNNFSAVASTYPKYRDRSGTMESLEKRVNDCIERSLNGKKLDEQSREMKAFVAYILWVGKDVPREVIPAGAGLLDLPFLDRAADPQRGQILYQAKCRQCHGDNGEGLLKVDKSGWVYPPLWGDNSYNTGAGIFRLSRMAGYLKVNMPNGAMIDSTALSDDEAWDLAAFINSQPRPMKEFSSDWPDISTKPFDHPFGPFADGFSEQQHKLGPFMPIIEKRTLK